MWSTDRDPTPTHHVTLRRGALDRAEHSALLREEQGHCSNTSSHHASAWNAMECGAAEYACSAPSILRLLPAPRHGLPRRRQAGSA